MKIRVMWIACVGIVLIVAGIGLPAIYAHWLETGSIVVLDMPLSLTALVFCGSGLLVFFITDQVNKHAPTHAKVAVSENPGYEYYPSRRKRPLTTHLTPAIIWSSLLRHGGQRFDAEFPDLHLCVGI